MFTLAVDKFYQAVIDWLGTADDASEGEHEEFPQDLTLSKDHVHAHKYGLNIL